LAPGSSAWTVLGPLTHLIPGAVAVDAAGAVYVTDAGGNDKVFKLAAAPPSPSVLPFVGLSAPDNVAIDKDGNVYVADAGNKRC
jgi:serine/threonine-protein kinase